MGGKRTGNRKHLFIYITCALVVSLVLPSCGKIPVRIFLEEYSFRNADALMNNGQYAAALAENKRILADGPVSLNDQALYRIALIYTHNENNLHDLFIAREYFMEIINNYPESILRSRAKLWVQIINKMERSQKAISVLNADKSNLNEDNLNLETEKADLNNEINILKEDIEKKEKKVILLEKKIVELETQIEDLKQIDLGLEQKQSKGVP